VQTFTDFVRTRHAHNNPRGDFIEDTKGLIRVNRFPDPKSLPALEWFMVRRHARKKAIREARKVWREYEIKHSQSAKAV
jgi:hypothetical protein